MLNWNAVLSLEDMPTLESSGQAWRHLKGSVYQLSDHEYAIAPMQYDNAHETPDRYVSYFVWASNLQCVNGLILTAPGTEEVPICAAPRELLIENRLEKCEEILRIVRWGNHGNFSAGPFGLSISLGERTFRVSVGRLDYFFSAPFEDWTGTTPVLIKCHTSDHRWTPLR